MNILIKLSQAEANEAIRDIPKGIGLEASDEMKKMRSILKELKVNEVFRISKGKTKTILVRKKNKEGDLVDTGKTRTIDENHSLVDQAVRYLNKTEGTEKGRLILFKAGKTGEYRVSRVSEATYNKFKKEYVKDGKMLTSFNTKEWRRGTKL
jgi:hypothetical protein